MMANLSGLPACVVIAVAAGLFALCLLVLLWRFTKLSSCGVFVACGAVVLTGLAAATLFVPLSLDGQRCGPAAGVLGLGASDPLCHSILTTVFQSAAWLALAGLGALFVSFAPSLAGRLDSHTA